MRGPDTTGPGKWFERLRAGTRSPPTGLTAVNTHQGVSKEGPGPGSPTGTNTLDLSSDAGLQGRDCALDAAPEFLTDESGEPLLGET